MRIPRWLAVVFFASVTLNVGVLAGYAYQTCLIAKNRHHTRRYFQGWAPDAERRFNTLLDERLKTRWRIDSLRLAANERLDELTYVAEPDSAEVESLLNQTAALERELAAVIYRVGRGINALKPPDIRRKARASYRRLMGLPPGDSLGDTTATASDTTGRPRRLRSRPVRGLRR
jgi:hypothetical protein